jgi:hypothetical protein
MFSKVMGGAIAVLLIAVFFLWRSNGNLREDLGAANTALDQAALTNETNVANFDRVNAELTACVDQAAADLTANAVTIANLEARYARLEIRSREVEIRREEIFRDPDCAELRDLDMAAICPDWANELRIRAATLGGNPDTGSAGPGADPDAGEML